MNITISVSDKKITDQKTNCFAFLLEEGFSLSSDITALGKKLGIDIQSYLNKNDFKGKLRATFSVPVVIKNDLYHLIFVGLGKVDKKDGIELEILRRALGRAYKKVAAHKVDSFVLSLPSE